MINRVVLVGRLTKDPELRYTTNGVAVVSFNLAVNRSFTNSQGEREADFISCVIWRKGAENFANFTHKGSLVGVDGRIQTSSYDNQQGQRIFRTDVILENFSLLEPKNQNGSTSSNNFSNQNSQSNYNQNANNFNNQSNTNNQYRNSNQKSKDPFQNNNGSIEISDDDLPF
ncbi:single-stranded DNA-binding protein [Companilactobacillus pabuli]|uniref:single-stranded DNA-binding protein n=1 Tax=Companilactobacillus pabuli TaxID=2714036 RepID=UPI002415D15F|nr:single-stranded DNA-binding protein [Companilactobacillus pabuli]MDG5113476.1 single-stranded DNA-binding protein [Companilactobacillus pabuli]